jgi:FKBP-type peptidyl-prolyl cis-trans isomerase SlyD
MNIQKDKVVALEYKLRVEGDVIDESLGEPLSYLHGHGNIVVGLENALTGLSVGEGKTVKVEPHEGYGEFDEEGMQNIPMSSFDTELEIGQTYSGEDSEGSPVSFNVLAIEGDQVLVDFNHPLAGQELEFEVKVVGIRDATAEELEHGHSHDGHHHHD